MGLIYAFSKSVKGTKVAHQQIADTQDVVKIEQVIQKLEQLPRVSKSKLDEINIRTNPRTWAVSLIGGYPQNINEQKKEYLLIDFTDAMKTRMREESKYAIGLLMPGRLILCHSLFGEETITPEWKIIPRMLDTDNVLRYVCFAIDKGASTVSYWEREATSSFIEWLGLPRKAAFLFGGKYRIYCEIEGITTEFQLDEEEMERWLKAHTEFREGQIRLQQPIELLNIHEIRVGRKRYESTQDFIQDYEAEAYGIPHYQKEYERITKDIRPLLMKYYDENTRVVRREGDEEVTEVMKSTPNFDILFVNQSIELRASYSTDIARRFISGESMRIFHAGLKFRVPPFALGNMEIYNEIKIAPLTQRIGDYYRGTKLQDRSLDTLLKYAILKILVETNGDSPIVCFLEPLSQGVVKEVFLQGIWTKLEDGILEYKSRDWLVGKDRELINKLSEELVVKLKTSPCKVFIIGIEDTGTVSPFPASRLKSDRIETMRNEVQNQLGVPNIYAIPIIQGDKGILLLAALR
ncbi:MAG: hypothetical protein FJZ93_06765 [Chloroflexi bacterium]|nr:hypothetical protein [Chloroflexota bacterium]